LLYHDPPITSYIADIVIDPTKPSTLFAGMDKWENIVWKSVDGWDNWSVMIRGIPLIQAMTIDPLSPSTLYVGTDGGGILKTTNGGFDWIYKNEGLSNPCVTDLAVDFKSPAVVYAATLGGGVFRSTDYGDSWVELNEGLTNLQAFSLFIDPIDAATIYVGTIGGGVYSMTLTARIYDFTNDGLINNADLDLLSNLAAENEGQPPGGASGGDTNKDGRTNIMDLMKLRLTIGN
jgi:photosystem II stability/assembly factor-like uncharacterized protein